MPLSRLFFGQCGHRQPLTGGPPRGLPVWPAISCAAGLAAAVHCDARADFGGYVNNHFVPTFAAGGATAPPACAAGAQPPWSRVSPSTAPKRHLPTHRMRHRRRHGRRYVQGLGRLAAGAYRKGARKNASGSDTPAMP